MSKNLSPIEEIIKDAKAGKMFILVDDEDRENEGDLVIPAEKADADAVNFMAKYGRGLICLSLTAKRVEELGLKLMSRNNTSRHSTAFTVSIEAREGVTTGISSADRATTIAAAISPQKSAKDIATPGHIFPLVAKNGGVLERAGHTEAAVDIAKLAGLNPSGVICEIMNDDGSMARMPDLLKFAKEHDLKIATIADLISYRRQHDKLISREQTSDFTSVYGGKFKLYTYINKVEYAEHLALVKGEIKKDKPTLVRMHAFDLLSDALGDSSTGKADDLKKSMQIIEKEGNGIIVLLREPRKNIVSEIVKQRYHNEEKEKTPPNKNLRNYGIGAQILLDLGVKEMILLTNSAHTVIGLEGYGLSIKDTRPIK